MELRLEQVSVDLNGRELVHEVDVTVASGEVMGLIGPNGSGKSTLLKCVYRTVSPSGVVRLDGDDIRSLSLQESARRVAAVTQDPGSDVDFTVEEVVALGRVPHSRGNRPLSAAERELCTQAMKRMDILHLASRGILQLSGGERQRALVARAIVQQPRILILDEPTNHLDIRHQIELLGFLKRSGLTVLIVLHDLNLAAATCDRLVVLADGGIVATGTPAEVLTRGMLADVFGVDAVVVAHPTTGDPQILFSLDSSRVPERHPVPRSPLKGPSS